MGKLAQSQGMALFYARDGGEVIRDRVQVLTCHSVAKEARLRAQAMLFVRSQRADHSIPVARDAVEAEESSRQQDRAPFRAGHLKTA